MWWNAWKGCWNSRDKKETMIAQQKQEMIKEAFKEWVFRDIDRREDLCRKYNDLFNSIRPREYDGSHIRFVGMTPEITLMQHEAGTGHNRTAKGRKRLRMGRTDE